MVNEMANVEVTGAARLHRAASSERSERGRPQGYALWALLHHDETSLNWGRPRGLAHVD